MSRFSPSDFIRYIASILFVIGFGVFLITKSLVLSAQQDYAALIFPIAIIVITSLNLIRLLDTPYQIEIIDDRYIVCTSITSITEIPLGEIDRIVFYPMFFGYPVGAISYHTGKVWINHDVNGMPALIAKIRRLNSKIKSYNSFYP